MSHLRSMLVIATTLAIAIGVIGAPVSAAPSDKPYLAVVQGRPGEKLDLCIDGREVRSNVRYGAKRLLRVSAGTHTFKAYKRHPGRCRGTLVARAKWTFPPGADQTWVVAKGQPSVIRFDNTTLAATETPAIPSSPVYLRHAARFGRLSFVGSSPGPVEPVAAAEFGKGEEAILFQPVDANLVFWATRAGDLQVVAGPKVLLVEPLHTHELIVVGSKKRNLKVATIVRGFRDSS